MQTEINSNWRTLAIVNTEIIMKTFLKKTTVQATMHQNVDRIIKVSIYKN